jgi:hypothetical protein
MKIARVLEAPPPMPDWQPSDAELDFWQRDSIPKGPSVIKPIAKLGPVVLGFGQTAKRNVRVKREVMWDLPALPVPDGVGRRFKWEDRALSRVRMARLKRQSEESTDMGLEESKERWFPQLDRRRVLAEGRKITPSEPFHAEVARYTEQ